MIEREIYQSSGEVIQELASKISSETEYRYAQISAVISQEFVQICNEAAYRATKRLALAMTFLVKASFILLLGFIFYITTRSSVSSFFISGFIWSVIYYFSPLLSPFIRKKSQETSVKITNDALSVMLSLRQFLNKGYHATAIITVSVLQTLGFWAVNKIMTIFRVEYLGFKTAVYFGIFITILNAFIEYYNGWKYYQRVKKAVVKRLSLQTRENAEYEVIK